MGSEMKQLKLKVLVFLVLSIIFSHQNCEAYDNKYTHRYINEKAVGKSELDTFLKFHFGFNVGINERIGEKRAWQWIRDGGQEEDEPEWRCLRHFHDPLNASWDNAGLLSLYQSMIYWSQTPDPANSYGLYNEYSWILAREYYHQALLTGSEEQYAKTFRAVGQLMHLVSDAAVPAHVRNDPHVPYVKDADHYEEYVKNLFNNNNDDGAIASLTFDNFTVDRAIFDKAVYDPMAPSPISALWDHDEYKPDGSNLPIQSNTTIGLAEYTNANFWTEDTFPWKLFSGNYPHPNLNDTNYDENVWLNPEAVDAEDGEIDNRIYFSKKTGDPVTHFMTAGYWYYQLYMKDKPEMDYAFLLDEICFKDYAAKLIPRAIGYSAALLDYFFRGSIEIALPAENHHAGAYAITTDPDQGFTHITLNAQNTSYSGEKMTNGSVELVVKYKLALDDPFHSYPVPTTEEFFYIVASESKNTRMIPDDEYVELEFDLTPAIPLNATDVSVNLVYKGMMGREARAIAVGYKDISEPTPIDIFSNLDKVCLAGSWYDAGSPEAIAVVDTNGNGIADRNELDVYPHDLQDHYIRISSVDDPQYPSRTEDDIHIPSLHAGEFIRTAFILSDDEFTMGIYHPLAPCTHPYDDHPGVSAYWSISPFTSVKNQTDRMAPEDCISLGREPLCSVRHYPTFTLFRGIAMRGIRTTYEDQSWGHDTSCSLDDL